MVYKEKVIESLRELSDETFQRRVWLASSGPEISSFDEAVCSLFNDSGLEDALERPQGGPVFGEDVDERLRRLGRVLSAFSRANQSMPPKMLIEHPKIREIRRMATEILSGITQGNPS